MSLNLLTWYVGDRNPSITETITVDGAPVDLTGASVAFKMRAIDVATPLKVSGSANIVGAPTNGNVRYDWLAGDLDTEGLYIVWWEVTISGKVQAVGEAVIQVAAHGPTTNAYVQPEQLKQTLNLQGTSYADLDLDLACAAASRAIDAFCGRRFYTTVNDEARLFTPPDFEIDRIPVIDTISVTTVKADQDGDGTFEETWAASDYVLTPTNADLDGRPYQYLAIRPSSSRAFPRGIVGGVEITGKFGWAEPPFEVTQAAVILASQLLQRSRIAPWGVVPQQLDSGTSLRIAVVDPQVRGLLTPYRAPVVFV